MSKLLGVGSLALLAICIGSSWPCQKEIVRCRSDIMTSLHGTSCACSGGGSGTWFVSDTYASWFHLCYARYESPCPSVPSDECNARVHWNSLNRFIVCRSGGVDCGPMSGCVDSYSPGNATVCGACDGSTPGPPCSGGIPHEGGMPFFTGTLGVYRENVIIPD